MFSNYERLLNSLNSLAIYQTTFFGHNKLKAFADNKMNVNQMF